MDMILYQYLAWDMGYDIISKSLEEWKSATKVSLSKKGLNAVKSVKSVHIESYKQHPFPKESHPHWRIARRRADSHFCLYQMLRHGFFSFFKKQGPAARHFRKRGIRNLR